MNTSRTSDKGRDKTGLNLALSGYYAGIPNIFFQDDIHWRCPIKQKSSFYVQRIIAFQGVQAEYGGMSDHFCTCAYMVAINPINIIGILIEIF